MTFSQKMLKQMTHHLTSNHYKIKSENPSTRSKLTTFRKTIVGAKIKDLNDVTTYATNAVLRGTLESSTYENKPGLCHLNITLQLYIKKKLIASWSEHIWDLADTKDGVSVPETKDKGYASYQQAVKRAWKRLFKYLDLLEEVLPKLPLNDIEPVEVRVFGAQAYRTLTLPFLIDDKGEQAFIDSCLLLCMLLKCHLVSDIPTKFIPLFKDKILHQFTSPISSQRLCLFDKAK